jgi:hypothetical protein
MLFTVDHESKRPNGVALFPGSNDKTACRNAGESELRSPAGHREALGDLRGVGVFAGAGVLLKVL